MRLILLRHAKAEKAEPGARDRERRLNERGRKDAQKMGAYMAQHALVPDQALVSPSQRTRETFEGLAAALHVSPPADYDERLYNAGPDTIIEVLKETGHRAPTLLLIGHNPGLHDAARLLVASGDVGAREQLNEGLPTSGLVVIDFPGADWKKLHARGGRLERFVSPRLLKAASRGW